MCILLLGLEPQHHLIEAPSLSISRITIKPNTNSVPYPPANGRSPAPRKWHKNLRLL